MGFKGATEIQQLAIPSALNGSDLIASSQTGSGKTLAYLLPVLHNMLYTRAFSKRDPRAVVLAPTRELANQVYAQLRLLIANTQYTAVKLIGGDNFNDQAKILRKQPKIIVATPGRLADHLTHRHLTLESLEVLVFDEADRMLDLGFSDQLKHIHTAANHRKRQTLLFSATLDNADVLSIGQSLLNAPKRIAVGAASDQHQDITQHFYLADHLDHKKALLAYLVKSTPQNQIIIFTATRDDTQGLAEFLVEQGMDAAGLSGNLSQAKRNSVLDDFSRSRFKVLVTTDVSSRGLDLKNVSAVINFDLPKIAEEYIHRIGRTGRAGFKGDAYSIVGKRDWQSFEQLKAFLQIDINFSVIEGLEAKFKGVFKTPAKPKNANAVKAKSNKAKSSKPKVHKPKKKVSIVAPKMDIDAPPLRRK